jgi:hypothetical protein
MSIEVLSTAAAVGTFMVIAATAIAAVVQLRHLRAQNQLTGLLTVLARVEDPNFNAWVDGARSLINEKMNDLGYWRAVQAGSFERGNNPWLNLGNSYEWVGSLVSNGLIPERAFMDIYSGRVADAWNLMEPATAVSRLRSSGIWTNFEYLAVRADVYLRKFPEGFYPHGVPRKQFSETALALAKATRESQPTI